MNTENTGEKKLIQNEFILLENEYTGEKYAAKLNSRRLLMREDILCFDYMTK